MNNNYNYSHNNSMNISDAYKNLYTGDLKSIDKNLGALITAKKTASKKSKSNPPELEME